MQREPDGSQQCFVLWLSKSWISDLYGQSPKLFETAESDLAARTWHLDVVEALATACALIYPVKHSLDSTVAMTAQNFRGSVFGTVCAVVTLRWQKFVKHYHTQPGANFQPPHGALGAFVGAPFPAFVRGTNSLQCKLVATLDMIVHGQHFSS